jgi:pyruvate formate lyase activating enzyme
MRIPATPDATLRRAHEICGRHLKYVYVGNALLGIGQDTACPGCGACLVQRRGYAVRVVGIQGRNCARCGEPVEMALDR